jgi:succinoglycan biosynthesis transport protein ExoP
MISDEPSEPNHIELPMRGIADFGREGAALPGSEVFTLQACGQLLRRRRGTIFSVTAIITILAALYAFRTKPVYESTAKIEVDADTSPLEKLANQAQPTGVTDSYLQTQVDILKSDDLAWRTIAKLGLDERSQVDGNRRGLGGTLEDARARRSRILAAFERRLQVRLAPGSQIILVSFEDTDPNLAQQIPNTLAEEYLAYHFMAKYDSVQHVSNSMTKELVNLKRNVETSQQALVNYEKQNGVADLSARGDLSENSLDDLGRQLTAAQNDLAVKQSLYKAVQRNPSAASLLMKDPLLTTLQEKYGQLETSYAKATAQYGPAFYVVVQIRRQIDEVKRLIGQEENREQAQAGAEYRAASRRVAILSRDENAQKVEVQKVNQLQVPYNILKNEYQTNQHLYQSLLERLKGAEISAGLKGSNVHVLDRAPYPLSPVRPKKTVDIAVGLLSGLLLGLTLAFVGESLDSSVRQPEELESVIGAPVLGVIPEANSILSHRGWPAPGKGLAPGKVIERSLLNRPRSPLAEAYRAVRTALLQSPGSPQVLLFTSTQPREGKTSTCVNLGLSLAQLNRRVLVIDADLRRGQIQDVFQSAPTEGLSDILAGTTPAGMAIRQAEEAPSLWVLTSGARPPSPADLLSSPLMERVLEELRARFDFILIDSPPLLLVTDAAILAKLADGTILVTSSETTARQAVSRALRILETAGVKLLGAVVNRVDVRRNRDYGYCRSYHHYFSPIEAEPRSEAAGSNHNDNR